MTQLVNISLGQRSIEIGDLLAVAQGHAHVTFDAEGNCAQRLHLGHEVLRQRIEAGVPTYGVNTGFGASAKNVVPLGYARELARNLPRYHGCGLGALLTPAQTRAVVLARLASLISGYSGVRPLVIERLVHLLDLDVLPQIPSRGSVGASGDLTPLSYVCAMLMGEREVWHGGETRDAAEVHEELSLEPIVLEVKESLAIMNGTSVMSALLSLAVGRAERLARKVARLTAMAVYGTGGNPSHFDRRIFEAKLHPGSRCFAGWVREDLEVGACPDAGAHRIQDRYSLRCSAQIVGVLLDAIPFWTQLIEREINGASDNPLVDPDRGEVLHGGNFYGGHMAFVGDGLKTMIANLADMLDRQIVLMNLPSQNGGLPENLVGVEGEGAAAHHGFKALEITASALTAEALKATMPASVFSRSTEGHNQDKVSMGSLSANDALAVLDLVEQVAAAHLLVAAQAVELRGLAQAPAPLRWLVEALRAEVPALGPDRRMDLDHAHALKILASDLPGPKTLRGEPA